MSLLIKDEKHEAWNFIFPQKLIYLYTLHQRAAVWPFCFEQLQETRLEFYGLTFLSHQTMHTRASATIQRERLFFTGREKIIMFYLQRCLHVEGNLKCHTPLNEKKKKKLFGLSGLTFEDDFLFLLYLEKYEDETLIYLNKCHAKILLSILACALVVI